MNKGQKIIMVVWAVLIMASCLYLPTIHSGRSHEIRQSSIDYDDGWTYYWTELEVVWRHRTGPTDLARLLSEWVLITVPALVVFRLTK